MKDHVICSWCEWEGIVNIGVSICPSCESEDTLSWVDPNEPEVDDRDDSPFEPNAKALDMWADHYDDLNGAPEGWWDA